MNGGHFGVPKQSSGNSTLFSYKHLCFCILIWLLFKCAKTLHCIKAKKERLLHSLTLMKLDKSTCFHPLDSEETRALQGNVIVTLIIIMIILMITIIVIIIIIIIIIIINNVVVVLIELSYFPSSFGSFTIERVYPTSTNSLLHKKCQTNLWGGGGGGGSPSLTLNYSL